VNTANDNPEDIQDRDKTKDQERGQEHDWGFKDLLSNPAVFASLLKTFFKAEWTNRVSPEALEMVPASFITPPFKKREADIIYKLKKTNSGEGGIYFYCLLELQSTVDHSIPIRLLVYMASLLMEYLKNIPGEQLTRKGFRLPAVIPIVLYNGEDNWTVPREFSKVYEDAGIFGEYMLNFKYYLLDVNRLDPEELLKKDSLLSAVFYIDRKTGMKPGELPYTRKTLEKVKRISPVLEHLTIEELNIFLRWFQGIVLRRMLAGSEPERKLQEILENISQRREVSMFVSNFGLETDRYFEDFERAKAEYERIKPDYDRIKPDYDKIKPEYDRLRAENEQIKPENDMLKAEIARLKAELAEKVPGTHGRG
jgi:hypothetical protein